MFLIHISCKIHWYFGFFENSVAGGPCTTHTPANEDYLIHAIEKKNNGFHKKYYTGLEHFKQQHNRPNLDRQRISRLYI